MRDTRQMDHRLDIPEQRPPFDRTGQIGDGNDLDRSRKNIRRLPNRCPHHMSRVGKFLDQGASEKARCTCHKYARHDVPRGENSDDRPANSWERSLMWQGKRFGNGLWPNNWVRFAKIIREPNYTNISLAGNFPLTK